MLEPPLISESLLVAVLQAEWGLRDVSLTFIPLGADLRAATYRATTAGAVDYFVKLRFAAFDEASVLLASWLAGQGIVEVLAPLPSRSGRPFAVTPDFTLLVYPFVEGHDAYKGVLTDEQWLALGRAVRRIHDAALPPGLTGAVPREQFGGQWRAELRYVVNGLDIKGSDPIARCFARFLYDRRSLVLDLVQHTDALAEELAAEEQSLVLCHTDLHPGNLLVDASSRVLIVDWDAPLLAPRERDLMYPGGAQGFPGRSPEEEEALFFEGYGAWDVDIRAVAYYRMERIIEDLAVFSRQLLGPAQQGESSEADREQALGWAVSNFEPGHTIDVALLTYRRARGFGRHRGSIRKGR